jgi:hypothetical protein
MPGEDIGESLVGAYLRHIEGCDVVVYNNFFRGEQGEIDVVGIRRGEPREVILCEVTTHIRGMLIVHSGRNATEQRVKEKLRRLIHFAEATFPGDNHRFEWWSPYVPIGRLTTALAVIEHTTQESGHEFRFVINDEYTRRVQRLVEYARKHEAPTGEPAYRLLQILTHLRGDPIEIRPARRITRS